MILEEKSYRLSPASKLLLVLQSLNAVEAISRLDQALREARAEGMREAARLIKEKDIMSHEWLIRELNYRADEAVSGESNDE